MSVKPKYIAFVLSYVETSDPGIAYCRAFGHDDDRARHFASAGRNILKRPDVSDLLTRIENLAIERSSITKEKINATIEQIAFAYADELVRVNVVNCRHCHGIEFRFQWMHDEEFAMAVAEWQDRTTAAEAIGKPPARSIAPSDYGGYGFDPNAPPNPRCPKCLGRGETDVALTAARDMTAAARRLYAGAKYGKYGIEVKMRDQDAMLLALARIHGVLKDSPQITAIAGAVAKIGESLPDDPIAAAAAYAEFVKM